MSKRNKKPGAEPRRDAANAVPAPVPSPESPSETDRRQDRSINRAHIVAVGSAVLSLASFLVAVYTAFAAAKANRLNGEALDRAAGKVSAKFRLVKDPNRDANLPKEYMRPKVGSGEMVLRLESPDELVRWDPRVRVTNVGGEPIDAVQIEVRHAFGGAYGYGVQQITPLPVIYDDSASYESTRFGKLMPGQTATLVLAPLLLAHMTRDWVPEYADQDRFGVFRVSAKCRMVGVSSYDLAEDREPVTLQFHWRPAGFKPDSKHLKDALKMEPYVIIE